MHTHRDGAEWGRSEVDGARDVRSSKFGMHCPDGTKSYPSISTLFHGVGVTRSLWKEGLPGRHDPTSRVDLTTNTR